jgi:hypothetical protein
MEEPCSRFLDRQLQIFRHRRKLLQSRLQLFSDLRREHIRIRQVRAVFERFVS